MTDFSSAIVCGFRPSSMVELSVVSLVDNSLPLRIITMFWSMYSIMKFGIEIFTFAVSFPIPFPRSEDFADSHKDKSYIIAMKEWNKCATNESRSIENKLEYNVFVDILHEMITDMHINDSSGEGFLLEHLDLGLQNIFVDDDFNITCIIDWELCSTVLIETPVTHPPLPS